MEVVIVDGPDAAGRLVGGAIADLVGRRPDAVLGLATGSSPLAVYRDLARRCAAGEVSLARARAFLLDEYVGLPPDHPQRYRAFIAASSNGTSTRLPTRSGPTCATAPTCRRLLGLRAGHPCRRRHRPAAPGRRRRRPHRLQRARVVAGVAHPAEDADRHDPGRQRPLLRLDRRGPPPRRHPGGRHDPRGPPPGAGGVRRGEGRGRGPGGRGAGDGDGPGVGAPAPPPRARWSWTPPRQRASPSAAITATWAHKPGWQGL